jgi:hypothetical protein
MMKSVLDRFIAKYNLNGTADKVTWKSDKSGLSTRFISDDRNVVGEVSTTEFAMDPGEYYVYETSQLRGLLGVLSDDITVKVQTDGTKTTGLTFSDKSIKTTFVLAKDASTIPGAPNFKNLPKFEFTIKMDRAFMDRFIKAKGALSDVDTFAVVADGKTTNLVLGHSKMNTNRIALECEVDTQAKMDAIHFHARCLRDVLVANKEADEGTLEVSSEGLIRVKFTLTDFTVAYYLPEVKLGD